MPANYDKIAKIYDVLSRMVFGKNIVKAQVCMLPYIPANSSIVIVGGGTGWILEELAKQYPEGLTIDYVENSAQMIVLSKKRKCGSNVVNYINLPIEDFKSTGLYDVILTPFVFDNFTHEKAGMMFGHLNVMLKKQGRWLYADFVHNENEGRLWQKLLLKIMYLFFRITTGIETRELADVTVYFERDYEKIFERGFYFKFITSSAYQKR
jgi:ubiquinone/menaquinone biosynthesis C-methylase UbiE